MNNETAESKQPTRAYLRQSPMSCDSLTRYGRDQDAKCKQTSNEIIDWSFLLKLNPPPGYSPFKKSSGISTKRDDPVITILRKILRDLENDTREKKRQLRESRQKERERRRKERLKAMTQSNSHVPVLSGAALKARHPEVKPRRLRRQVAQTTEDAEVEQLMTRSLDRALPREASDGLSGSRDKAVPIVKRESWGVGDRIKRMSADILGRKNRTTRWRDHIRPRSVEIPADRSLSNGTSGYSTEERSTETSDSDDNRISAPSTYGYHINDRDIQRQLNRYFLVLPKGTNMALQVDESKLSDQEYTNSHSFMKNISMSDLALPDHMGWLTDQSEYKKVWGIVVDMLFCIFENKESEKPSEVILLPGCNIRPLVYKTAMNGLHTRKPGRTITGVAKFQIVIDNSSTRQKHLFSFDTQHDLDTWYRVLKKASNLDADLTNDVASERQTSLTPTGRNVSNTSLVVENGSGYMPSQDSPNRVQKMSKSSREDSEESSESDVKFELRNGEDVNTCVVQNHVNERPSPRPLIRNESRRQSIQDFRKRLRREMEPEMAKQVPLKAQHFQTKQEESKTETGKKIRSFGSIESLLKFKRKRKKKDSEDSTSEETISITSASSFEPEHIPRVSSSVDFSATRSQMKSSRSKSLTRSLEFSTKSNDLNNGLVRRASDLKDKFFQKRPVKRQTKLGDLTDVSIHGYLQHKRHYKWQKLWCVVCRGCFYGFRSQSPDDSAYLAVVLSNCVVIYMTDRDRSHKHQCVFKLSQENAKSIYLCASDIKELQQWLQVLQMEANNVQSNVSLKRNVSIDSSQAVPVQQEEQSRSRSKKKRAPPKPPRHSSCPPPVSRDALASERGTDSLTDDTGASSLNSSSVETGTISSLDDVPTHDKAVSHVWQNDRGYLFNVIRAKLKAYKNKDPGSIYNKDLPGPGNEGLLLVDDVAFRKGSRDVRRSRSFNAGSRDMEERTSPGSPSNMRKRHKPLVVKKVPAKDLENSALSGYLERKCFNGQWVKYWYVLHEGTLFCYLTSDDNVTVDVLNLNGYSVTAMVDKFRGKRFVLQLSHENFTSLYLSMESREDLEEWQELLKRALGRPACPIRETEDGQDNGACAGCENNRLEDVGEKAKKVKQKLLEEMLRQKHELERKQAERQRRQKNKDPESPDRSPNSTFTDFMAEDTQRLSDVTRLRQRRLSTQLKMDTIQKQMQATSNPKRGLFSFGKHKKSDENKNVFLQDQLKELSEKLDRIDTDLSQVEQDKLSDTLDVNQNKQQVGGGLDYVDGTNVENSELFENDSNMGRTNSIKSRVQKLANRPFGKGSVKSKKRSKSPQTVHNSGSMPDLTAKQNSDIINGHSYDSSHDISTEDCLSSDNSVTDLTRPADLPLDLASSHNGSNSPASLRYNRSNSRSSTLSNLSSPRREINPSVLAEIDAFEELSRQVLSARSKEMPAK